MASLVNKLVNKLWNMKTEITQIGLVWDSYTGVGNTRYLPCEADDV